MNPNKNIKKIKATTLVSLIVHGANPFGKLLAKTLLEQGSKVILIDYFTKETKPFIQELKKDKNVDFIEFEGLENLFKTITKFDYLFYLQFMMFTQGSNFTSKDFLNESANLDKCTKAVINNNAKMSIVTSFNKNKELVELTQFEDGKPKPYSDLEIQRYSETITAEQFDKSGLNIRIIRMGSLIGGEFHGFGDNTIENLFENSVFKDSITIKGEGLENHYFYNTEDALFSILRLTFDNKANGEVISLANEKPLTTLSVAYKLLELNTDAKRIDFEESDNESIYKGHYVPAPFALKFGIKPKFTIEETFISAIESLYKSTSKKWNIQKDTVKSVKSEKSSVLSVKTPLGNFIDKLASPLKRIFSKKQDVEPIFNIKSLSIFISLLTLFLLLSYFVITPIANIAYSSYKTSKILESAYSNALAFELGKSTEDFKSLKPNIDRIKSGTQNLSWLFSLVGQKELHSNILQLVYSLQYATEGAEQMSYSLEPLGEYFNDFTPAIGTDDDTPITTREYRNYLEELRSRRFQLTKASDNLYLASLKIDSIDISVFPKRIEPFITILKNANAQLLDKIKPFQETVYFLPEMLGVDERQRYLILFQNPAEIRSTGGWISSYAIIGIEGGQIRQLDVDDIYNLDGLLKVQGKKITPPETMKEALDIDTWTMSLSNWDPDFAESSKNAVYFVKEAGKVSEINGVIAVDTEFLKKVIDIWGSISIEGEEPVTSENLQEKIFEMHTSFTPGSQTKSDFIAKLFNEVLRLALLEKSKYPDLLNTIYESMNKKNFLVYLNNSDANKFFSSQGWDGTIKKDYYSSPIPIEWNWGGNKANIYLEEVTNLQIKILDEKTIQYTYTLSTKNNSSKKVYPEGDYVNYMRLIIPYSSVIDEKKGFTSETTITSYKDAKIIGGWFNTTVSGSNQLSLKYTLKDSDKNFPLQSVDGKFHLDLSLFKQPGLYPSTYKLEILYPDTWSISEDSDFTKEINKISSQFELTEDMEYQFIWNYK